MHRKSLFLLLTICLLVPAFLSAQIAQSHSIAGISSIGSPLEDNPKGMGLCFVNETCFAQQYGGPLEGVGGDLSLISPPNPLLEILGASSLGGRSQVAQPKCLPNAARPAAPNLTLKPLKGKKMQLSSLKGKVVYVDVWASWCSPCFASFPSLQILKDNFEGRNVVFLTISADEKKGPWKKVSRKKKIPGTNVWAGKKKAVLNAFNIPSIPRYILIDKNGRIYAADAEGPSKVGSEIEKLLAE